MLPSVLKLGRPPEQASTASKWSRWSAWSRNFDHVAVFRQPDAWSTTRTKILTAFACAASQLGSKYNLAGLKAFKNQKQYHEDNLQQKQTAYFTGEFEAPSPRKEDAYTCSEFVATCFMVTGFIEPSAAIVYDPGIVAPVDLGRDPTWGIFVGYCSRKDGNEIPTDDEFYNSSTFAEIFENDLH